MGELSEVLRLLRRIEDRLEKLEDRMVGLGPPPVPMTPVQIELIRVFTPVPMPAEANDTGNDLGDAEAADLAADAARDAADDAALGDAAAAEDLPPIEGVYQEVEAAIEGSDAEPGAEAAVTAPAEKKSRKRGG
jgi:hypothetical protein